MRVGRYLPQGYARKSEGRDRSSGFTSYHMMGRGGIESGSYKITKMPHWIIYRLITKPQTPSKINEIGYIPLLGSLSLPSSESRSHPMARCRPMPFPSSNYDWPTNETSLVRFASPMIAWRRSSLRPRTLNMAARIGDRKVRIFNVM